MHTTRTQSNRQDVGKCCNERKMHQNIMDNTPTHPSNCCIPPSLTFLISDRTFCSFICFVCFGYRTLSKLTREKRIKNSKSFCSTFSCWFCENNNSYSRYRGHTPKQYRSVTLQCDECLHTECGNFIGRRYYICARCMHTYNAECGKHFNCQ